MCTVSKDASYSVGVSYGGIPGTQKGLVSPGYPMMNILQLFGPQKWYIGFYRLANTP